jgi:hypothetical protein
MAKKIKQRKTSVQEAQNNTKLAAELAERLTAKAPSLTSRNEFNPDYSMVKRDLARIATLAGFFIVVLVVLSFFIK